MTRNKQGINNVVLSFPCEELLGQIRWQLYKLYFSLFLFPVIAECSLLSACLWCVYPCFDLSAEVFLKICPCVSRNGPPLVGGNLKHFRSLIQRNTDSKLHWSHKEDPHWLQWPLTQAPYAILILWAGNQESHSYSLPGTHNSSISWGLKCLSLSKVIGLNIGQFGWNWQEVRGWFKGPFALKLYETMKDQGFPRGFPVLLVLTEPETLWTRRFLWISLQAAVNWLMTPLF